ncbi:MAG: DMT family transporter [Cyanobacteria bacterium J06641_5]
MPIATLADVMTVGFADFKGELAALLAALFWSISATIYARTGTTIPALELNALKGAIATGFLLITLAIGNPELPDLPWQPIGLLLISGVIGIGLGDTAFLAALQALGTRRTLLLETIAPPLTAILATVTLSERLPVVAWGAIALTVAGIFWVISERAPQESPQDRRAPIAIGILWALLAAISQASGVVLTRAALYASAISPLWSALLRLVAGTLCAVILLQIRRQPLTVLAAVAKRSGPASPVQPWRMLGAIALAALLGTYLGIWLQQTALKFTSAGIAQTLLATSPLFILPLDALRGDRPNQRAILGAAIATAGVALLFLAASFGGPGSA